MIRIAFAALQPWPAMWALFGERQSGQRKSSGGSRIPLGNALLRRALWMPTLTATPLKPLAARATSTLARRAQISKASARGGHAQPADCGVQRRENRRPFVRRLNPLAPLRRGGAPMKSELRATRRAPRYPIGRCATLGIGPFPPSHSGGAEERKGEGKVRGFYVPRRWIIRKARRLPFVIRLSRKKYVCSRIALQRWLASRPSYTNGA
jgi:hypothetical protein